MAIKQPLRRVLKKRDNNSSSIIKSGNTVNKKEIKQNSIKSEKKNHKQKYGVSKLEVDFAHEFLDKLGLKYIYEYEASDIGRYFDFAITSYPEIPFIMEKKNGIDCIKQKDQNVPISFIIEVDGGYFHSDPRIVNENKLNKMQKRNKFVDFKKTLWCENHGYPLLRIWEYDIRKNPQSVIDNICKYLADGDKKKRILENKKKPH